MRPVVMPAAWFPEARRQTIGGELGSEPAEYVILPDEQYGAKVTTLVRLDDEEAAAIAETGYLFLTIFGGELPWNISPAPEPPVEEVLE